MSQDTTAIVKTICLGSTGGATAYWPSVPWTSSSRRAMDSAQTPAANNLWLNLITPKNSGTLALSVGLFRIQEATVLAVALIDPRSTESLGTTTKMNWTSTATSASASWKLTS